MTNGLLQPESAGTAVDLRKLAAQGTVHFMGIAGAGMSALAELVLRAGGKVSGCDTNPGDVGRTLEASSMSRRSRYDIKAKAQPIGRVATFWLEVGSTSSACGTT
jgi:UDP-N-acetylmuramate-alanine ligase